MKRKRSKNVSSFSSGRASPYKYGSNRMLPRPQERVPRSLQRSLMPQSKSRLTLLSPAKRSLFLQVARKRLSSPTPLTRKVSGRFSFPTPFARQYEQMLAVGSMVRNPKRVFFCVKRKLRREVLFAFRKVGFRGSSPGARRSYRRNGNSLHGC